MDYIQTIESDKLLSLFALPNSFLGKKVEVIVRPVHDTVLKQQDSAFGCLHKYANPALIPEEDRAWEKAVKDKYANS
ncbi:MAG: hypothetical protein FWB96_01595 [Defluviitaleaceae bacterium]|nr:hypothetical protein [Defluviitaleaceae bacterium]MCL2261613.1 hypothetical protein [Defluviitaleaceae bacterium]